MTALRLVHVVQTTKRCAKCAVLKSVEDFHTRRSAVDGRHHNCKPCANAIQRAWRKANIEKVAKRDAARAAANPERKRLAARRCNLRRQGWTVETFAEAWAEQKGLCAMCGQPMLPSGCTGDSVVADHDHDTGDPRALIHQRCNTKLGIVERWAPMAEAYLAKHGGK